MCTVPYCFWSVLSASVWRLGLSPRGSGSARLSGSSTGSKSGQGTRYYHEMPQNADQERFIPPPGGGRAAGLHPSPAEVADSLARA